MILTIITGASRGIGKAIKENLKDLKHDLYGFSSETVDLEKYMNPYYEFRFVPGTIKEYEQVNLILCAARLGSPSGRIDDIDLENMDKLYKINVLGNLAIIKAICEDIPNKLRIVWFAGGGAAFPFPEFFGYSLSKIAVVRAVENLSIMLKKDILDVSIIALAPGAVNTDMLKKVIEAGSEVRTKTDISEPVNFVRKFITDEIDSLSLNGRFIHVRDDLNLNNKKGDTYRTDLYLADLFKIRRIE